jgi:hypothetical protein
MGANSSCADSWAGPAGLKRFRREFLASIRRLTRCRPAVCQVKAGCLAAGRLIVRRVKDLSPKAAAGRSSCFGYTLC